MSTLLSKADERYTRHYELKRLGYDLDKIAHRVGAYGVASVGLGPAFIGISGQAGLNVENQLGIFPYYGLGLQYGLDWGLSLRAGLCYVVLTYPETWPCMPFLFVGS